MDNNFYDITEVYLIIDNVKKIHKYDYRRYNLRQNVKKLEKTLQNTKRENYSKDDILNMLNKIL